MIPSCLLCSKFGRRCIYQKHAKTPLTRRHLTDVEEELARTKALLQQVLADGARETESRQAQEYGSEELSESQETTEKVDGRNPNTSSTPSLPPGSSYDAREEQVLAVHQENDAMPTDEPNNRSSIGNRSAQNDEAVRLPQIDMQVTRPSGPTDTPNPSRLALPSHRSYRRSQSSLYRASEALSANTPDMPMETPPSSGSFEWDERTGKASGDKFVDGMASLTSRSNEGGYLGILLLPIGAKDVLMVLQVLHQALHYFE